MSGKWPWPDSTQDRLRRIIDVYRTCLMEADEHTCRLVDARMIEFGQGWVCSESVIDVNRMVTAQEIAEEFGINTWNVHDWARRHPDLIPKHKKGSRTLFRLGDVLTYQAQNRHNS